MIRSLLRFIFPPFTRLEKTLIQALIAACYGESKRLLELQLSAVNLVQRHRDGKEVILFRMRGFSVYRNPQISFPVGEDEVRFATATFSYPDDSGKCKAEFWITRGFFSLIVFNKIPKKIGPKDILTNLKVRILRNPTNIPDKKPIEMLANIGALQHEIKSVLLGCHAEKAFLPLPEGEMEEWLQESDLTLPADLATFLGQINGFITNDCEFFGVKGLRVVEVDQVDFVIAAEHTSKGALAFQRTHPSEGYYFLDYGGANPKFLARTYADSTKMLCLGKVL